MIIIVFSYSLGEGAELGLLEPWHAEQFLATLDLSRDHLATTAPAASSIFTVPDARKYLQKWADGHASDSQHLVGLWLNGKLSGCFQFVEFNARSGSCELGAWITPGAEGRGLVTRSCRYLIDWAIRERGLSRVVWSNDPANVRSSAVARRLGMTREGLLRSAGILYSPAMDFARAEVRWDMEIWSIIADEWPTKEWRPEAPAR